MGDFWLLLGYRKALDSLFARLWEVKAGLRGLFVDIYYYIMICLLAVITAYQRYYQIKNRFASTICRGKRIPLKIRHIQA